MTSQEMQLLRKLTDEQLKRFHSIARLILECISAYQRSTADRPDMPFLVLESALSNLKIEADVLRFMLAVLHHCGYISVRAKFGVMVFYSVTGKPYSEDSEDEVNQASA